MFKWPLREEILYITNHSDQVHILIDDFKVPGMPVFEYDEYNDQECSYEHIKDVLNSSIEYQIFYPAYTTKTSKHHPLKGWGFITSCDNDFLAIAKTVPITNIKIPTNN